MVSIEDGKSAVKRRKEGDGREGKDQLAQPLMVRLSFLTTRALTYQEGEGHLLRFIRTLDLKTIGVRDVGRFIRHRQSQGAAANTILRETGHAFGNLPLLYD
jgi:hypothetical protein